MPDLVAEARALADHIEAGPLRRQSALARAAARLRQLADRVEVLTRQANELAVELELRDQLSERNKTTFP